MNVDERLIREMEHGKYLASAGAGEIWNWESAAGKVRWRRRVEMLSSVIEEGDKVLELGCGTGYFTKELVRTKASVTAIDISQELIREAQKTVQADNVSFEIQNACRMEFNDNLFDKVIGSSVLHHLDIRKALSEIHRVLRPGGRIAFTEPNMMNPQIALQKNIPWLKKRLGDSPDETAFFRWKLKNLMHATGFEQVQILPFDFLHPSIPAGAISLFSAIGRIAERLTIIKEIAGSLHITARKRDSA
jgi:ubiquinone/menaquinone biosynthesis C-methylase UbiE